MTMIAIATYGDRAELITDSLSYTRNASGFGRCSKSLTIPHLDAAVLTQGEQTFGISAKVITLEISGDASTFDQLVDEVPAAYRGLWDPKSPAGSIVFLVGYSPRAEEFVAYAFASEADFEPVRLDGLFVIPSPWTVRPSDIEMHRATHKDGGSDGLSAEHAAIWASRPAPSVPNSLEEWADLAYTVRSQRALEPYHRILVAGDVFHTTLIRGASQTGKLLEFDDGGDEFNKLIAGTEHPVAQALPCHCGSGKTWGECHLSDWYADGHLCDCGSNKPWAECCRVATTDPVTVSG